MEYVEPMAERVAFCAGRTVGRVAGQADRRRRLTFGDDNVHHVDRVDHSSARLGGDRR
jgi:hypothetical protein